jgi:gliding motility-associated-like protein
MKSIFFFFITGFISFSLFGQSPSAMKFIENKGQWDDSILYSMNIPNGKFIVNKNSLGYYLVENYGHSHGHGHNHAQENILSKTNTINSQEISTKILPTKSHFLSLDFLHGNKSKVYCKNKLPERYNYFKGKDKSRWAENVSAYSELYFENLYPQINLKWYENNNSLKYDFIVLPGGNPSDIKIKYNDVEDIYIREKKLYIKTEIYTLIENEPYIYQEENGNKIKIQGEFILHDSILSFKIKGRYDKSKALIIDPSLIFSTYSGSLADNWGNTAAFDSMGYMYSGGTVFDPGFPVTNGTQYNGSPDILEVTISGTTEFYRIGNDIAISKYSPDGKSIIYATYIGGYFGDIPYSLVVNKNNELIVTGSTSSDDFPVTPLAYDTVFNGGSLILPNTNLAPYLGSDLFICKLSNTGNILASTYLGGFGNEGVQANFSYQAQALVKNYGDEHRGDVIVDKENNIYIASNTSSSNFPVSSRSYSGAKDGIVAKLDSNLKTLIWSTYVGGNSEDALYSIQLDSSNNVYVCGGTNSASFPFPITGLQKNYSGNIDGLALKLSNDGLCTIMNSTYLGTNQYDQSYFVQIGPTQDVYFFGQTKGNYLVTPGKYTIPKSGQFIHCLSPALDSTIFSTVIGSGGNSPNISPTAFLVNDCGNIFLSGWGGLINRSNSSYVGGNTKGLPVTSDAFRGISDGSDFYIAALDNTCTSLLYATYFGSYNPSDRYQTGGIDHVDGGTSRFDPRGIIYEAVCASCNGYNDFPTTPGAHSNTNNSNNCNNASFKFDLNNLIADFTVEKNVRCDSYKVIITNTSSGGKSFEWDFGDGQTYNGFSPGEHIYASSGTYTIRLIATDLTTCIGRDTVYKSILVPPILPIAISPRDTSICKGDTMQLFTQYNSTYKYLWSPKDSLSNDTIHNPLANPSKTTIYTLTVLDTFGCEVSKRVKLTVIDVKPDINFSNVSDCTGKLAAELQNNTIGVNYNWIFGDGTEEANGRNLVTHEYAKPGTYTVYLNASKEACSFSDSITFTLEKVFLPNLVTPNSDGKNDVYEIKGKSKNWQFEVYNRWGDLVYKSEDYNNDWFGEKLNDGVYYYLIISPNDVKCKGWVQLLR